MASCPRPFWPRNFISPHHGLKLSSRPRLIERLNEGLSSGRKLTLISAAAGFGKTTLVSEWIATLTDQRRAVGWLSLDEGDNDPARFLTYLIAALQTIAAEYWRRACWLCFNPRSPRRSNRF